MQSFVQSDGPQDRLGRILLKGVIRPTDCYTSRFEIWQKWYGWKPLKIRPYLNDLRIQALKRFWDDQWDERIKKVPRMMASSPFRLAEKVRPDGTLRVRDVLGEQNDVKPVKPIHHHKANPEINAMGKNSMEIRKRINALRDQLKTAGDADRIALEARLEEEEKEFEKIRQFMEEHGMPLAEEYFKNPDYWLKKKAIVEGPNPRLTLSPIFHKMTLDSKSYDVENIDDLVVAGRKPEILGMLDLSLVLIPDLGLQFNICQTWTGWEHEKIQPYMIDSRMRALKRLYFEIEPKIDASKW